MDVGAPNFKPWRWFFYTQVDIPASGITPQHFVFRKQFTFRAYLAHLREFPSVWIVLGRFQSFPANMHLRTWKHALVASKEIHEICKKTSRALASRHRAFWNESIQYILISLWSFIRFNLQSLLNMHAQYARPICTANMHAQYSHASLRFPEQHVSEKI